jgi:hypothetical protein
MGSGRCQTHTFGRSHHHEGVSMGSTIPVGREFAAAQESNGIFGPGARQRDFVGREEFVCP